MIKKGLEKKPHGQWKTTRHPLPMSLTPYQNPDTWQHPQKKKTKNPIMLSRKKNKKTRLES